MPIPTTRVVATPLDLSASLPSSAKLTATLVDEKGRRVLPFTVDGDLVAETKVVATRDGDSLTMDLWPNPLGTTATYWQFELAALGERMTFKRAVPEQESISLHELYELGMGQQDMLFPTAQDYIDGQLDERVPAAIEGELGQQVSDAQQAIGTAGADAAEAVRQQEAASAQAVQQQEATSELVLQQQETAGVEALVEEGAYQVGLVGDAGDAEVARVQTAIPTASEAEAEAGDGTEPRLWSPARVKEAVGAHAPPSTLGLALMVGTPVAWDTFERPDGSALGDAESGQEWESHDVEWATAGRNREMEIRSGAATAGNPIFGQTCVSTISDPRLSLPNREGNAVTIQGVVSDDYNGGGHVLRYLDGDNAIVCRIGTNSRGFEIIRRRDGANSTIYSSGAALHGIIGARAPLLLRSTLAVTKVHHLEFWIAVQGFGVHVGAKINVERDDDPAWFDSLLANNRVGIVNGYHHSFAAGVGIN